MKAFLDGLRVNQDRPQRGYNNFVPTCTPTTAPSLRGEFKELMDFWDIKKQVTRGHAYFAKRTIRTIKEAMLRLKPNQRKEARCQTGGAKPSLH